jgi:glycosyltransferase A (GT-A) superfamily protein (DUF2064 family)
VFCPDRDGGFNLVGIGGRVPAEEIEELFDHPMSRATVLGETLARAGRAGRDAVLLPPGFDLDRFDDLRWLAAERRSGGDALCPRTVAFLDEHGLWPAVGSP